MKPSGSFLGQRNKETDAKDLSVLIKTSGGTSIGSSLSVGGSEWEYAGDMTIDANSASDTTLTVENDGGGVADLVVEGTVTLGGLMLEGDTTDNFVVNAADNVIDSAVNVCALISGGGTAAFPNLIGAANGLPVGVDYSPPDWAADAGYVAGAANVAYIMGGYDNVCNQLAGIIGGRHNFIKYHASGHAAILSGGYNCISASNCLIVGGVANAITSDKYLSVILGGIENQIVANWAAILGGKENYITGDYGIAGGRRSRALHNGSLCFSDSQDSDFDSEDVDSFNLRYQGGYYFTEGEVAINETTPGAQLHVTTGAYDVIGAIIEASSSQSANLQEWHDDAGDPMLWVYFDGYLGTDRWLLSGTNTFLGYSAAGAGNLAHGSGEEGWYNTYVGFNAGDANTSGYANTGVGAYALTAVTTGYTNAALGRNALDSVTEGYSNIGIGYQAGDAVTTGDGNIAIGQQALAATTTVNYNIAIGHLSGNVLTSSGNVALGYVAMWKATSGGHNTAIGYQAGMYNVTGTDNTYLGYGAGKGASGQSHEYNVMIGSEAGNSITTGSNIVNVGYQAGYSATTTGGCVHIGYQAGYNNTTANHLYIENSNSATPLIAGDFANDEAGINVAPGSIAATFHVDQSASDGAKPVLYLDQADVSEEFIRFVGTAANGVLTQSIVDEGDQGSETREGWLKVYVQDDGNQITDQAYYIPIYSLSA